MFGKRKTRFTADGWYYLVIMGFLLAGALMRDINLLLLVFGIMVAALIWHWRHGAASLKRLSFRRHAPRRVAAGEPLVVDLVAHNARRRGISWAVVVQDFIRRQQARDPPLPVSVVFTRLAPREDTTESYQGQLARRGRYVFGPLRATTRFPLGLLRHTALIDHQQTLLVVPRQGRLTDRWRLREQHLAEGVRSSQQRRGPMDGDFHGLRPYRSGDSRHLIHWRTSARRGQLMVRQFEQQRTRDLAVFLDLRQTHGAAGQECETVELAISLAATVLADRCRRSGSRLLLAVSGAKPTWVDGAASATLLNDLMEVLALAEASADDGLPDLLASGLEQMPSEADVVLICTRRPQWSDETRFASVVRDPRKHSWLERMLVIDASQEQLREYFEP